MMIGYLGTKADQTCYDVYRAYRGDIDESGSLSVHEWVTCGSRLDSWRIRMLKGET